MNLTLIIKLRSDTTFGRGDGVAGLLNEEIEHDPTTGLPFVRGRTFKGLIVEECANLLYALSDNPARDKLKEAARWLFGSGGSTLEDGAHLRFGQGELPNQLQAEIRQQIEGKNHTPSNILEALTTIRRQTAVDERTSVPAQGSLRASRVLLRDMTLRATLDFDPEPTALQLALLSACVASVQRAGSGRNRGRGRVELTFEGDSESFDTRLSQFEQIVKGKTTL